MVLAIQAAWWPLSSRAASWRRLQAVPSPGGAAAPLAALSSVAPPPVASVPALRMSNLRNGPPVGSPAPQPARTNGRPAARRRLFMGWLPG